MLSNKALLIFIAALIVILVLPLIILRRDNDTLPEEPTHDENASNAFIEGEELEPEREPITEEIVNGLYLGHSYEEVEDLFGVEADHRESEYDRGISGYTSPFTIVWYTWENPDGTRVRLGFIGNKLDRRQFIHADGDIISNDIAWDDIEL